MGAIFIGILIDKRIVNKLYINKENEKKKILFRRILELCLLMSVLAVASYLTRNILQDIPFPLDGYNNFEYRRVKEIAAGPIILLFLTQSSSVLMNKISVIRDDYI
jgi:hypothetical protein